MTSDDVVRLAKEARFETVDILANHWKELHRFAALVAAAEREACAKVALDADDQDSVNQRLMQKRIAAAIRERGQQ